jgi:hypothetical protein
MTKGGAAASEAMSGSSSTVVIEQQQNYDNSCQDVVLDALIIVNVLVESENNTEVLVNGNNDNDCCFIHCGAAVDNIDDYVCGGVVPSGTTTTPTVAPTAAKVDSTARRNVWFNNLLLSIQDSVCGGNGMTRVEEDTMQQLLVIVHYQT